MKYNLNNSLELNQFTARSAKLVDLGAKVELKQIRAPKTVKQNRYLHVVIGLWAINYGYTLPEAKTLLKRKAGLYYTKGTNQFLMSTADLDSKELSNFIEVIRTSASLDGCYIPTAEEYLLNKYSIDKEINTNNKYL